MRATICTALLFLATASAFPQDYPDRDIVLQRLKGTRWEGFAETRAAIYELCSFDPTRTKRLSNGNYRTWIRDDYSKPQTVSLDGYEHTYDWEIDWQEVNCEALETLRLRQLLYKENETGATPNWDWTARQKEDFQWRSAVPDTTGETTLKLLCQSLRAMRKR